LIKAKLVQSIIEEFDYSHGWISRVSQRFFWCFCQRLCL